MCYKNLKGFTMAEVLITIGVIGIVAAMTLPGVIKNYQRKVLETQFKKSVSIISQVILNTKSDLSIDKLAEFCTTLEDNLTYPYQDICYDSFYKNFVKIAGENKYSNNNFRYNIRRESAEKIYTYNGKQIVTWANGLAGMGGPIFNTNLMPDGSFINMSIIENKFYIAVDTNGQKGPNKLGHDIFLFSIDKKNDTLSFFTKPQNLTEDEINSGNYADGFQKERAGNPCNFTSSQKANGIGCAWYALRDICPDGSNKGYFECLP